MKPPRYTVTMVRWLLLIVLFPLFTPFSRAQSDHLHQQFQTAEAPEERAEFARLLARHYLYLDNDSVRYWLETVRRIATDHHLEKFTGRALITECALEQSLGNWPEAQRLCEQGLALAWRTNDTEIRIDGYLNLTDVFRQLGRLPQVQDTLLVALDLAKATGDPEPLGLVHGALANYYHTIREYERTVENLEFADAQFRLAEAHDDLTHNHYLWGTVLRDMMDYPGAEAQFQLALETAVGKQREEIEPFLYHALGSLHRHQGEYDTSLVYHQKAIPIFEQRGDLHGLASNLIALAFNYVALEQPQRAIPPLERALPLADAMQDVQLRLDVRYLFSLAYAEMGNFRPAYERLKETYLLSDTVFSEQTANQLAEAETRYRTENIQRDLELSEQTAATAAAELKFERGRAGWLLGIAVLAGLLVVGLLIVLRVRRRKNALIQRQAQEKETLLRELHHRVKNNLQVVSSILALQSRKTTDEAARVAITDSQTRVDAMGLIHQKLYLKERLTAIQIKPYIAELAEMIVGAYGYDPDELDLNLTADDLNVDVETAIPLGLILNELLSNSFKHGFRPDQRPHIDITLRETSDGLHLRVADNGRGLPEDFTIPHDNPRTARTFGTQLLSSLARQLDARLTVGREGGGSFDFLIKNYKLA